VSCSQAAISKLTTGGATVGVALTATAACFAEREHPMRHNFSDKIPI
jgi:hypothetical protein